MPELKSQVQALWKDKVCVPEALPAQLGKLPWHQAYKLSLISSKNATLDAEQLCSVPWRFR